jgi:hypothetical protein
VPEQSDLPNVPGGRLRSVEEEPMPGSVVPGQILTMDMMTVVFIVSYVFAMSVVFLMVEHDCVSSRAHLYSDAQALSILLGHSTSMLVTSLSVMTLLCSKNN